MQAPPADEAEPKALGTATSASDSVSAAAQKKPAANRNTRSTAGSHGETNRSCISSCLSLCRLSRALFSVKYARVVPPVVVPIPDDRGIVGPAEHDDGVGIRLAVRQFGLDEPRAVATDADVGNAIAVEVARDRPIPRLAEGQFEVGRANATVAINVDEPLPVAEDGDRVDAVAVKITGHREARFRAEHENVIHRRDPQIAVSAQLCCADSSIFSIIRAAFRCFACGLIRGVGQSGLASLAVAACRAIRPKYADVVLAVAIPVANERLISRAAEARPKVVSVPATVAIEIDEPLSLDEHPNLAAAIAVEVAGDRLGLAGLTSVRQAAGGSPAAQRPARPIELRSLFGKWICRLRRQLRSVVGPCSMLRGARR